MSKSDEKSRAQELLTAAVDGALGVLRDPESPATAKASATGSAIRLFELLVGDDPGQKDPAEMTADEIQAQILRLRKEREGAD